MLNHTIICKKYHFSKGLGAKMACLQCNPVTKNTFKWFAIQHIFDILHSIFWRIVWKCLKSMDKNALLSNVIN